MTALYFHVLRPEDRVAVKPHASPVFHAIQYLLGNQSRDKMENFRGFGGAQSYPSRTKDTDDVDFSTGSVGLGVAMTAIASLVQDFVRAKGWAGERPEGRMVALVGDAELDEGNIYEALLEGWKQGLRNTWWIIDYNRQSLDAVTHEGLYGRFDDLFRAMGWEVVTLKYGHLLQAAFRESGGEALRGWIDRCPNQLYSALTYQGEAVWRRRLLDDIGEQGPVSALIESRGDEDLARLMTNLGGNNLPAVLRAFEGINHDRPVCFIAYTIKGYGLPFAGHKDNHAGLMNPEQMDTFRARNGIAEGREWEKFEGLSVSKERLEDFLNSVPFNAEGPRRPRAETVPVPDDLLRAGQGHVDPGRLRADPERVEPERGRTGVPRGNDLAGCHGLDQSWSVGQPPRAVRPQYRHRHLPRGEDSLDPEMGKGAGRLAYRARHRRNESFPPARRVAGCR